uniref:Leucine-rich repeat-containing N-terminal plant-type domain-containing protein n=1 Tax=Aegilops tauschii subsp. strangulata TaxID=200361 RepID=A0A453TBS9_AEGTS
MLCPEVLNFESNQLMAATAQDWEFMTFLTNCTRLRNLCIQANALGGVLPSSVGNLSAHLQQFIFGFNEISGKLPFGISNLVGLNVLDFPHNQFTDVLPDSIGRLNLLQQLYFNNNQFSGSLPSSLGNLTRLLVLSAGSNKFKGGLPTGLGNLQEITEADFSNNKFSGPLPKEIFNLSTLSNTLVVPKAF